MNARGVFNGVWAKLKHIKRRMASCGGGMHCRRRVRASCTEQPCVKRDWRLEHSCADKRLPIWSINGGNRRAPPLPTWRARRDVTYSADTRHCLLPYRPTALPRRNRNYSTANTTSQCLSHRFIKLSVSLKTDWQKSASSHTLWISN